MLERELSVINPLGLHARAAAKVVRSSSLFASTIKLSHNGTTANARSILMILRLAAPAGSKVKLHVDGEDEVAAAAAIEELFTTGFGEI